VRAVSGTFVTRVIDLPTHVYGAALAQESIPRKFSADSGRQHGGSSDPAEQGPR